MAPSRFSYAVLLFSLCFYSCASSASSKWPTVGISVLVRNKAHTLPYFLTCIQQLDYPKDRIYIWIHSENNVDQSARILKKWADKYGPSYNNIYLTTDSKIEKEVNSTMWDETRFRHVIALREKALNFARKSWVDYFFMIDADVFLVDKMTLKDLVKKEKSIVAPMLISDGLYSNFWCGMSEKYYYERTDDYKPILSRKKLGCFEVPMVHSAVLVKLTEESSDELTYNPNHIDNYDGPMDDIIAFAISARKNGLSLHICNEKIYGFVTIPQEDYEELNDDYEQLLNVKIEAIGRGLPLPLDEYLAEFAQFLKPWKYTFDEIYMINLGHRSQRRHLMLRSFKELGMDAKLINAVDGKKLDVEALRNMSITLMSDYEDPHHKRAMKMGEVGCFLSHYNLWQEIVQKKHKMSLVLEDDVHFEPYFRNKLSLLLDDLKTMEWDLVYIGRKILLDDDEEFVTERIVKPLYSYWTLGYLLSLNGAKKLLGAKPLDSLLPVDEFLPIMFNQHPNATWKEHFPNRDLLAFSASPLLIKPTHYTGEEGYVSDTEDSDVLDTPGALPNPKKSVRSDL